MEELKCELQPQSKTINSYLMNNDENICRVESLTRAIKENLFGLTKEEDKEKLSPTCMISLLHIENCRLNKIAEDLTDILKSLSN